MAPRVLVSDELSETAVQIFRDRGVEVDYLPKLGKDKDALAAVIDQYDGLAIRSATKVTEKLLAKATRLKVIGRAGIGVDNVDIPAASKKGVIVMNTPFGNSITTAEHAIAMMFAVARQIPEANASTHAGKWEKSTFMGVELFNKTLGVIGAGNIGGIVCDRAVGLQMKVIAYDPFLSEERAKQLGRHQGRTGRAAGPRRFHHPARAADRQDPQHPVGARTWPKTKKGVRIINCARGGLIDEAALADALNSGHVAGAALDVFEVEPATDSPLFNHAERRLHPAPGRLHHRSAGKRRPAGGRTDVGLPADRRGAERAEHAQRHRRRGRGDGPLDQAGRRTWAAFIGQMTDEPIKAINILYDGTVAEMNLAALNQAVIAGVLKAHEPGREPGLRPGGGQGARASRSRTTRQEKTGRVRRLYQGHDGDRQARTLGRGHLLLATASRASSRSRASTSTPRSARTCFTPRTRTCRASSAFWA